jgi:hypothetical protein
MPRARLAERILSLVVTPDRAASIVGDLVEASPAGRTLWTSVARIGISLLWKDVCARPGRMLYLATAGAFMNLVILATFGTAFFLIAILLGLFGALLIATLRSRLTLGSHVLFSARRFPLLL